MARVDDRARPTITLEDHDGPPWLEGHGQLVVALEPLPQYPFTWDDPDPDAVWDQADSFGYVWDPPMVVTAFADVWCDLVSLDLVTGEPDGNDQFRTPYARLTVRDPGDGRYRARTVDGRLLWWAPGRRLAVWWHDEDGADWWLFAGRIATWRDNLQNPDVTIEAYASLGNLAAPLGREWTAGSDGDLPDQRVQAILAVPPAYADPVRAEPGDNTLSVPVPSDTAPLDEIRRAVWSDGGIVFADCDDTVVVRDRRWRGGRADQTTVPTFTDNVCEAGADAVVGWDVTAADLDVRLAGRVQITNDAGLTATATNPDVDPSIVFTRPTSDLWRTQAEGDTLVAWMAANRADARLAIGNVDVHLHDRRFDYWHQALDRRIGDWLRFVHVDPWSTAPAYDVTLSLTTIRHQITADTWTVQLATTPAVAYTAVELWDWTLLAWDDPDPLAVWR